MSRSSIALLLAFAGLVLSVGGTWPEPAAGTTLATPQEELIVFVGDRVFFERDSASLDATASTQVRIWADWIRAHPSFSFKVIGHTDDTGSSAYNSRLGLRRALGVRDALVDLAIDPARLKVISLGEDCPEPLGTTDEARSYNRRVVLVIDEPAAERHPGSGTSTCGRCCPEPSH